MRIIKEESEIKATDSLSKYLLQVRAAIQDETEAIAFYDEMISSSKTPVTAKEILKEIRDDEKDHLVILTELLNDEVSEEFPGYGDSEESGLEVEEEEE